VYPECSHAAKRPYGAMKSASHDFLSSIETIDCPGDGRGKGRESAKIPFFFPTLQDPRFSFREKRCGRRGRNDCSVGCGNPTL